MIIKHNDKDISKYVVSKIEIAYSFAESHLIGNTVSKELKLSLDNYDGVFTDLSGYFTLYDDNHSFGKYSVYEAPEDTSETLKLTLYDNMLKLDINYNSTLAYPVKLKDQLDEIGATTGVVIKYDNIPQPILNKDVGWYDNTSTMRQYIGWIAELCGMNAMCDSNGDIVFYSLSKTSDYDADAIETYKKKEICKISRVCFDNGLLKYEKGSHQYNTLYISADNLYVDDQSYIDNIYNLCNGITFTNAEKIKMVGIDKLELGNIVHFDGYFDFMPTTIKWIWDGGAYAVQTVSGSMPSKAAEVVEQKQSDAAKIRVIKTTVDQVTGELNIVSKEIDELNEGFADLTIKSDSIKSEVNKLGKTIYKFETGSGNLFINCEQSLSKQKGDERALLSMDMEADINADFLTGKDICISVDVETIKAVPYVLGGRVGAYFSVSYDDGTSEKFELWYIPGAYTLSAPLSLGQGNINERIYKTYKVQDKTVTKISNLALCIECIGEFIYVGFPKVEIGTKPTGFAYDIQEIRDNIVTINKQYSEIDQQIDNIRLSVTETTEEITTIKGEVSEQETRLNSAELKLTPTAIVQAVNEKIGADGKLVTSSTTLDKDGFHVKGKGLDITNLSGQKVTEFDSAGNLSINGVFASKSGNLSTVLSQAMMQFFNGSLAQMTLSNNNITFSDPYGTPVGQLTSADYVCGLYSFNDVLDFGHSAGGTRTPILELSKNNGINALRDIYFGSLSYGAKLHGDFSNLSLYTKDSGYINHLVGNKNVLSLDKNYINLAGNTSISGSLYVTGSSKTRIVKTSHGGLALNAVESTTSLFEDNGSGTIGENGTIKIYFDRIFMETVKTDHKYYVSLTKCGKGDLYCCDKTPEYFVVKGTPYLTFDWCVKVKQKGAELGRLTKPDIGIKQSLQVENINKSELEMHQQTKDAMKEEYCNYYERYMNQKIGGNT